MPELLIGAAVVVAVVVAWAGYRLGRERRSRTFVDGLPKPPAVHETGRQSRAAAFEREVRNFRDGDR